jgi:dihydroorotate dehydrogenase
MKTIPLIIYSYWYRNIFRRILFLLPSETIHEILTASGAWISKQELLTKTITYFLSAKSPALQQTHVDIKFASPIGLSAGFDYQAQLTQLLPALGFGFGTIGTITNLPYEGNPAPRLGRLIKSRSLMVNKGFKNEGVKSVIKKLHGTKFPYPVGISIGRTNSLQLVTTEQSIADIVTTFSLVEKSKIPFAYYELNISCPNLLTDISFYPPQALAQLLAQIEKLKLRKPLIIKMPIDKSDQEILAMLDVITRFPVAGVIFGNLQKNRKDPALHKDELRKYPVGNFSGKPTEKRSNELIHLAYTHYGGKLLIIGCGGVFSAEDAYKKIKLGASLIQLITGLIYEGPQLVAQINNDLIKLLQQDGYTNISEAIGSDGKKPLAITSNSY